MFLFLSLQIYMLLVYMWLITMISFCFYFFSLSLFCFDASLIYVLWKKNWIPILLELLRCCHWYHQLQSIRFGQYLSDLFLEIKWRKFFFFLYLFCFYHNSTFYLAKHQLYDPLYYLFSVVVFFFAWQCQSHILYS